MHEQQKSFRQRLQEQTSQLAQLPEPDAAAQSHSEKLIGYIRREIETAGGRISFARYMELVLLAPGLGYYSAGSQKLGEAGDFVTAPEISPLFSRCIARQCAEVLSALKRQGKQQGEQQGDESPALLEFGAGSGVMAADILLELERLQSLPDHYAILEPSAELQQRQRDTLAQRAPHLLEKVRWLNALPAAGFRGVILANEVIDAMPVHRVLHTDPVADETPTADQPPPHWQELYVSWHEGRFQWQAGALSDERLQHTLDNLSLPAPYSTEVNLAMEGWIAALGGVLEQGLVLLIDYGFPRHEYYHAQRNQGTLMCHYRHRAHDDPFVYPGLQDITAHVDFTALAEAAVQAGLDVNGYCTQAYFLLSNQLQDMIAEVDPEDAAYPDIARQVRILTSPEQMGELFKVMALTRGLPMPLSGFGFRDQRNKL